MKKEKRKKTRVKVHMLERIQDLWAHRELLWNMTIKELKVKYKRSILGFLWSFMNPLLMLIVFSIVFAIFTRGSNIQWYAIFLMAAMLPWMFFVNSLMQSVMSIVYNPGLIKKVYFPREILPIASVGANLIHFLLQSIVLLAFMLIIRWHFSIYLLLFPLILLVQLMLTLGLALFVSAANVYLRDVQHFLEVATMAWFWVTPIVYPIGLVIGALPERYSWFLNFFLVNPMTNISLAWQYIIYNPNHYGPDASLLNFAGGGTQWFWGLLGTAIFSALALVGGYYFFLKKERGFAQEI